jgi:hypothetical protein
MAKVDVYKEICVEVDLDDFETDELVEELEARGYTCTSTMAETSDEIDMLAEKTYWQIRDGLEVTPEIRAVIASLTGKIL